MQGALNAVHKVADAARHHIDHPFQSETFASGGDFARFAIQKALSADPEKKEKELQALGQANDKVERSLDTLTYLGKAFLDMVMKAPPLRAILRGSA